jgi:hypothetical protein
MERSQDNTQQEEVSWGTIIKGAAIAAGVVAAIAVFPASLGAVGAFIAANPILTIGAAALAGGMASKQMAAKPDPYDAVDKQTFAMREDINRMDALMTARMRAMGMAGQQGMGIA